MPLDTFISGPYTATYNGIGVGLTDRGITLEEEMTSEDITSDFFGASVIDSVIQGGNVFLSWENLAYKAGSLAAARGWNTAGQLPKPGELASNLAMATVLTATSGTPAAASPASMTASKALTANGHRLSLEMAHRLRRSSVRQRCYPYLSSVYVHYLMG